MRRFKISWAMMIFGIVLMAGLTNSAYSQGSTGFSDYLRSGNDFTLGILDPSRLSFSHNIQSTFMTSSGQSVMRNMFMETIGYQFKAPVSLTFNVGYMHEPYLTVSPDGFQNNGQFLGSAAVTWRPTDNMFLHLEVANFSKNYYGYPYGLYSPYFAPSIAPGNNFSQPKQQEQE